MEEIRRNARIRLLDEEDELVVSESNVRSSRPNRDYNNSYASYDNTHEDDEYEDTYEEYEEYEEYEDTYEYYRVNRQVRRVKQRGKFNFKVSEWSRGKKVTLLLIILMITGLIGWCIGTYIGQGKSKIELTIDGAASAQEQNVYNVLNEIVTTIQDSDLGRVSDNFIDMDTKQNISKDEAKALVEYFKLEGNETKLVAFSGKIKNQVEGYLGDNLSTDNKYFVLVDDNGKLKLGVNRPNVSLLIRTKKNVKILANGTEVNREGNNVIIPKVFPAKVMIEGTYKESEETLEIDIMEEFLKGKEYTGQVSGLLFKHGVPKTINISCNSQEGDIYVNGDKIDEKLEQGHARIDGLEEGDTVRIKYKNKMSGEVKVKKDTTSMEFEFDLSEFETRFNLPKRLIDSLENKVKSFLNSLGNSVASQNTGAILSGVTMDSFVQGKVSGSLEELVSKYNSLLFSNIKVTNAIQSGDSVTVHISYTFDTIDKLNGESIMNGSGWIKFDGNSEIIDFDI